MCHKLRSFFSEGPNVEIAVRYTCIAQSVIAVRYTCIAQSVITVRYTCIAQSVCSCTDIFSDVRNVDRWSVG
jgi:hypothetical protein